MGPLPICQPIVTCGSVACLNPKHLDLRAHKPLLTVQRRQWGKVERGGDDECWPWTAKTPNALGLISLGREHGPAPAHRLVWQLERGPVPERMLVRQHCGNRLCCNPAHLFLVLNAQDGPEVSAKAVDFWLRNLARA